MASFYGELIIRVKTDTSDASRGLTQTQGKVAATTKSIERSLGKTGLAMQNVGRTMTQYYTLPVVAGLGYATYAAYKYQKAMIQVQNLTGLSAQQAAKFSDEIRQASAEIGNAGGPQAAAEAFYFLASSGLDASEAMDALRVSMKASVAGMGDIQVLADVVTSAMNSYGHEAYNATEAMDVLMRTIEVGKAEPTALATSLGRIMPIANQLKVDLEELGGNVAALTLGGLSSAEAVTALRGTMAALVSPAKMSIDTLKTLGLTYQEVTRSIAEKGLLPTLKMLWEATDHNMLLMRQIIPNIRATTGVMSLLGANYEKNLEVIARVNDSQGKLNETYRTAAQSDVAKFNRALNELKSTFIEIGAVMLPLVTKMVKWLAELLGAFQKLSPATQEWTVKIIAATAALFPLLSVIGSVTRAIGLLAATRTAVAATSTSLAATSTSLAEAGAKYASVGYFARTTGNNVQYLKTQLIPIAPVAGAGALAIAGLGAAIVGATIGLGLLIDHAKKAKVKANLTPDFQFEFSEKAFVKEMKKGGWEKKVIDGIVYWNYTVVPKRKEGEPDPGRTVADEIQGSAQRAADRVAATREWLANEIERIRGRAFRFGGKDSLAAIFGSGEGAFKGLGIRPRIAELTAYVEETQRLLDKGGEVIAKGFVPFTAEQISTMKTDLMLSKDQLQGLQKYWDDAQASYQHLLDLEPKWDITGGTRKLRQQMKQYMFDMRAALGKPIKMPRIDVTKGDFKGQLKELETWITQVTRSRELNIEIKKKNVRAGMREIQGELDKVNRQIKKTGITPDLRLKRDKLNEDYAAAKEVLDKLERKSITPKASLDTSGVSTGVDTALAEIARLPQKIVIPVSVSKRYGDEGGGSAWGGIFTKPKMTLVGEEGPEVIIPLTKPRRAQQLLRESGLGKYLEQPSRYRQVGPTPKAATASVAPTEVHYHNHLTLPQGAVVSDIERFGRTLQPYVERGTLLAEKRRLRGRPGL